MSIAGNLLMIVILLSAGYALRDSRRNLASWAIVLGLVYYHPLIFSWESYSKARVAYGVMYFPLAIMAILGNRVWYYPPVAKRISIAPEIYLGIFIASLVGVEVEVGLIRLMSMKFESGQILDTFSRFSILMYASGVLYAVSALSSYKRRGVIIACLLFIFFVAIGDRTQPAFIALYGLILYSVESNIKFRHIIVIVLASILLLYGKQLYLYILTGSYVSFINFSALSASGLAEPVALVSATESGMGYEVDLPVYLHKFILYMAPFSLGENLHLFQDVYKNLVFPWFSESAGAGGNIIVEIFWNFGYVGLLLFGFGLCFAVAVVSRLSRYSSDLSVVSLLLFVVLFMYMPRNSVFSIISHEKKIVYTFVLAWMIRKVIRTYRASV